MKIKSFRFIGILLAFVLVLAGFQKAQAKLGGNLGAIAGNIAQNITETIVDNAVDTVQDNGGVGGGGIATTVKDTVSTVQDNGGVGSGGVAATVADVVETAVNENIDQRNENIGTVNNNLGTSLPSLPSINISTTDAGTLGNYGNTVTVSNSNGTSVTLTQGGYYLSQGKGTNTKQKAGINVGDSLEVDLKSGYVVGTEMVDGHSEEYQKQMLAAGILYAAAEGNDMDKLAAAALASTNLIVWNESSGGQKISTKIFNADGSINYGCTNDQPFYIIPNVPNEGDPKNPSGNPPVCDDSCACANNTCVGQYCINDCNHLCLGQREDDCSDSYLHCIGNTYINSCGNVCQGTKRPGDCSDANLVCVGDTYVDDCGFACVGTKEPDCSCADNLCVGQFTTCGEGDCKKENCEGKVQSGDCSSVKQNVCKGVHVANPCGNDCVGEKDCNGKCAEAINGKTACSLSGGACDYGEASNFKTFSDHWTWDCVGDSVNGVSVSDSCSATKKCDDRWIETSPQ